MSKFVCHYIYEKWEQDILPAPVSLFKDVVVVQTHPVKCYTVCACQLRPQRPAIPHQVGVGASRIFPPVKLIQCSYVIRDS